jgi:crotonobetainyl-CoA:carnitine CoA-transferase CaiB-like acyl-CoA transferase
MFKQGSERMINWREFDALIEPFLSTHSAAEILMTAQALRLPFAPVPNACDLLEDEHLVARGFFPEVATAAGTMRFAGPPFRMSETPLETRAAPGRGEANADVLGGELGYAPDELQVLSGEGVS